MSTPAPMDDLEGWLGAFTQPTVLLELLTLALCVAMAWGLVRMLRQAFGRDERSIWFGRKDMDGVLFPLALLCLGFAARTVLSYSMNVAVFKVAVPVLEALVAIRTGVKVLQGSFTQRA